MLNVYRRHGLNCKHRDRKFRACRCSLWIDGTLAGKRIHKSLHTRNWERAQGMVQDIEAAGALPEEKVTTKAACDSFIRDAEARELKKATVAKYKLLFERLRDWSDTEGIKYIADFTLEDLRRFRSGWAYRNFALRNQTERLRALFTFAHDSGWVTSNVAKKLKAPMTVVPEVVPFSTDETDKIIKACDGYTPKNNALRLKALVLLMLNSGLRIGDAVNLERSKVADGRLTLRTQKKNVHVSLPLPPDVVTALDALPATSTFFFTTGEAQPKAVVGNYQNYLRKLFKLAGVTGAYPHKFRHTFAARLLSQRVPVENVSKILGHSSTKVTVLHYSPWIKERQELLDEAVKRTWGKIATTKSATKRNRQKSHSGKAAATR